MDDKVNLREKLASFDEHFQPKIVGYYNDDKIQVGKIRGEFVWHSHPETDDFFLVLKGRPGADEETHLLLLEPRGTRTVGDADAEAAPEVEI